MAYIITLPRRPFRLGMIVLRMLGSNTRPYAVVDTVCVCGWFYILVYGAWIKFFAQSESQKSLHNLNFDRLRIVVKRSYRNLSKAYSPIGLLSSWEKNKTFDLVPSWDSFD